MNTLHVGFSKQVELPKGGCLFIADQVQGVRYIVGAGGVGVRERNVDPTLRLRRIAIRQRVLHQRLGEGFCNAVVTSEIDQMGTQTRLLPR